ncbi:MAG: prolyl oligopeptidase family serine peptidase [Cyclobacteriaceae bacterium]
MKILLLLLCLGIVFTAQGQSDWDGFSQDSVQSALDDVWQPFYYRAAEQDNQPLAVVLHTWSGDYTQTQNSLAQETRQKGWNYIHPNFRGPNNHPKACGSTFALDDIDQAIGWALKNLPVNPDSVFVIGASGGGYATLCTYMKSRHRIKGFHAYVPISDVAAWYHESLVRDVKYAHNILASTNSEDSTLNVEEAKRRSPFYWENPPALRAQSSLHLYTGVHDGYTGSVPITQSINFYNKMLRDAGAEDSGAYVDEETIIYLLTKQAGRETGKFIGNRKVHLQKSWKNVSLTIFEGTHEMLTDVALELL